MSDEMLPSAPDVASGDAAAEHVEETKPVTRRAALKVIGSVPIAGALMGGSAFAQQGTPSGAQQPKLVTPISGEMMWSVMNAR